MVSPPQTSELLEIRNMLGVEATGRLTYDDLLAMSPAGVMHVRSRLEADFVAFCLWVFPLIRGVEFIWTTPQQCTYDALHGVETGLTKRLIINEPPRFGKTEIVEILWPAWHLLKNPRSCWLIICASDELVRLNSSTVRDILRLPEVRLLWPKVEISQHTNDKSLWMTTQGGYFRAVPVGGQITGFGAGRLNAACFAGALIMGDMLKAQDALSVNAMMKVQQIITTTVKNRLNDKNTPMICEAQRLHDADPSGFFLVGGTGEKWHHAVIPGVVVPEEYDNMVSRYKTDWSYGIPLDFHLPPGFVWPGKYAKEQDDAARTNMDSWTAQVVQNPRLTQGSLFRVSWFRRYDYAELLGGMHGNVVVDGERIALSRIEVFVDTAQKTKEANDYSVLQLWGRGIDGNIYLLDQIRGKWEAPELLSVSTQWLQKYEDKVPRRYGWRMVNIEDKSSGTGLIQQLTRVWGARVNPIPRSIDKVSRALGVCLPLEAGRVYVPKNAPWLPDFMTEIASFSKQMTHAHDDQVDPMIDAIVHLLEGASGELYRSIG